MRYAKLNDGYPAYAPNPILVGENYLGNPPGSVYEEHGYKPVGYADQPSEAPAGYYWAETWAEEDGSIRQGWVLTEQTEFDGEAAMDFLFGGDAE